MTPPLGPSAGLSVQGSGLTSNRSPMYFQLFSRKDEPPQYPPRVRDQRRNFEAYPMLMAGAK